MRVRGSRGFGSVRVSVGIKALNEEQHVRAALESAIRAVAPWNGEVVLADCGSRDRTIEVARQCPDVRVLQLADPSQKSCGAGAQLAFQTARGEYFYLLDADMVLQPDFLAAGIAFLDNHPRHAGVGGIVREVNTASIEFEARARNDRVRGSARPGDVDRLDCGGLYRSEAIRTLGYFADRNLHAFEEFELAARLSAAGWKLARIDVPAVEHHGHSAGGLALIWRRIASGYAGGTGEVLRAAMGQPHFGRILTHFSHMRHAAAVVAWWLVLLALGVAGWWPGALGVLVLPVLFLSWRRRSLRHGLYSVATWNMHAIGFLQGIARGRISPRQPLACVVLQDGAP